jgi:hypothetical protein
MALAWLQTEIVELCCSKKMIMEQSGNHTQISDPETIWEFTPKTQILVRLRCMIAASETPIINGFRHISRHLPKSYMHA